MKIIQVTDYYDCRPIYINTVNIIKIQHDIDFNIIYLTDGFKEKVTESIPIIIKMIEE